MGNYDYSYTINSDSGKETLVTNSLTVDSTSGTSTSCTVYGCGCTGWHYWYPYTYGYTTPTTKYLYQIFCPKPLCPGKFWAELNEVKACPVCKSRIKVTDKESDYEVAVTK